MGKDLKGRELGKGIVQRKDGRYYARFTRKNGERMGDYFNTPKLAKEWLEDKRYEDKHGIVPQIKEMTVDDWFHYWMENIVFHLSPNTRRNYAERYKINIQPVIGKMDISKVRPMHCQRILKKMHDTYAGGTIAQTYIALGTMFRSAVMNDIISKHPLDGVRYTKPLRPPSDIHFLTVEEQQVFMNTARRSHNYFVYSLILETGLRTGELIGLTFDCVDLKSRTLKVEKTLEYRHKFKYWRAGAPKTKSSYRTIPLTDRAYQILKELYDKRSTRKEAPELAQVLEYEDRLTGETKTLNMKDLVFVNFRTGMPNKNSSYDTHIYKLCDECGLDYFCMHALRHTFATRAIEYGVQPKVLMQLLGHASIKTTMDKYVHNTTESLEKGIKTFSDASNKLIAV